MAQTSIKPFTHSDLNFAGRIVQSMLDQAGIVLNGVNPWDIQIKDISIFPKLLMGGSLALGETYVEGKWDTEQLDELINRLLRSPLGTNRNFISVRLIQIKGISVQSAEKIEGVSGWRSSLRFGERYLRANAG